MTDLNVEYDKRQHTWGGFLRLLGYSAAGAAIVLLLMWIFLI